MAKISLTAISQLLKLTERRIQQLAKDGIIPKADRGEYDMIPVVHAYIDFLMGHNMKFLLLHHPHLHHNVYAAKHIHH